MLPRSLRTAGLAAPLLALATALTATHAAAHGGVIRTVEIPAPSLRNNLLGDPDRRAVSIYLPPQYFSRPRQRFPVIYLLHGFAADNRVYFAGNYQNFNVRIAMDSLIAAGKVRPMIVVTPSARNRFDGSFYANSPVTGRWEDFITRDLVGYIDRHYRTIPRAESRGLAGHSMGGYGALNIGMRNPRTFSAIYALSPCCLGVKGQPAPAGPAAWRTVLAVRDTSQIKRAGFIANLVMALAAVYSPNPGRPPLYLDYPFAISGDSLVADPAVMARWQTPLDLLERYRDNLRRLTIGFDSGDQDGFPDIPANVRVLAEKLRRLGIEHCAEIYPGDHGNRIRARLESVVFPFFSSALTAASPSSPSTSPSRGARYYRQPPSCTFPRSSASR